MKNLGIILTLSYILPLAVFAQICVGDTCVSPTNPVPVPYNRFFPIFAPGGAISASGLILSLIDIGLAIAGLVAVIFLIVGGFRYVTAQGNEEQVESAKKTLTHAILGIVIIILAFVIVRVIANALIYGRALT